MLSSSHPTQEPVRNKFDKIGNGTDTTVHFLCGSAVVWITQNAFSCKVSETYFNSWRDASDKESVSRKASIHTRQGKPSLVDFENTIPESIP